MSDIRNRFPIVVVCDDFGVAEKTANEFDLFFSGSDTLLEDESNQPGICFLFINAYFEVQNFHQILKIFSIAIEATVCL